MAVGGTLRRLACRLALIAIVNNHLDVLKPQQLGLGTPNGAEGIIHAVSSLMESLDDDEAILQIDFSNAFNLVSRPKILNLVGEHFPHLQNLVNFLYSTQGFLKVGRGCSIIRSCTGVQQGCPLAPLLFSLVLRELVLDLEKVVPNLKLNKWYLDDGHLVGKVHDLKQCLAIIISEGPKYGLYINMTKCVAYGLHLEDFPEEVMKTHLGLMVLGSPVGKQEFVVKKINEKICAAALTLFRSKTIEDPQKELLLLRCCSGSQKLTYWMRTCDPRVIANEISCFDRAIDDALQHILGSPVFGDGRLIMHLPLSLGGLGIPIASFSCNAAFVSSIGSSWDLQNVYSPRLGYAEAVLQLAINGSDVPQLNFNLSNTPLFNPAKEFRQSKFMLALNQKILENIVISADEKLKIILSGRSCKGSSY
jgi:hypothetical protein